MTSAVPARPNEAERYYNYAYLDEQTKRMIRRAILKALAIPGYQVPFGSREMPVPYGWGTGGIQLTAAIIGPQDVYKCIDQGADDTTNAVSIRQFFAKIADVETTENTGEATIIQTRHRIPEKPLKEGQVLIFQVPQPEPLRGLEPRETETRAMHAYQEYGLQYVSLYENVSRYGRIAATAGYPVMIEERYLMSPSPIPKFDNPKMGGNEAILLFGAGREKRIYAVPPYTSVRSLDFEDYPFETQAWDEHCALCGAGDSYLDEVILDDTGAKMFVCSDSHHCTERRDAGHVGPMAGHQLASLDKEPRVMNAIAKTIEADQGAPLLRVTDLTKSYGHVVGCRNVSFELRAGEVLGVVGESGSGKTTMLNCISGKLAPSSGLVEFDTSRFGLSDIYSLSEPDRRRMQREEWGFVHQNPRDGLRMRVSGGANVAEPLMNLNNRHYGKMRKATIDWLDRVELDTRRIDDKPANFSGGMQQRIQVARNLIHGPRLVFMDEPTGGLDVSVQARLLDLLRELVRDLGLAVIIVTHDMAVARLMADRLLVMKGGDVVETGLTDQVLDDPQHPYSQLLVSSVLQI